MIPPDNLFFIGTKETGITSTGGTDFNLGLPGFFAKGAHPFYQKNP
jgi:hypothetical protein